MSAARRLPAVALLLVAGAARGADWFPCLVEPYSTVQISTAVAAVVEDIRVSKGEPVEAGQIIATLDSEVERAALEYAEARKEFDAAIEARRARLELSRRKLERAEGLVEKNYITETEFDEMQADVRVAEHELEEALEERRLARLEVPRARAEYEKRVLRSPIDGIVVERLLEPGEFAQAQPIMRLAQLDPLRVEVVLPVSRYGSVRAGDAAIVRLPDPPIGGEYEAEVTVVEQVIDAGSATFGVRLEMPNPRFDLPAGLECEVRFENGVRSDFRKMGSDQVFRLTDGRGSALGAENLI